MKKLVKLLPVLIVLCLVLPLMPFSSSAESAITENLWDFNTSYCGYYNAKGEKYYSHQYQTSADIPVKEGDVITMAPVYDGQAMYLMTLDAQGIIAERITSPSKLENVENLEDSTHIKSYTIPAGVTNVRITCQSVAFNTFVITKNNVFSVKAYNAYIEAENNTKYSEFRKASKIDFSSKTLLWCGDSVGAGSYEWHYEGAANAGLTSKTKGTMTPSWAGRMKSILGLKSITNPSHGGATYSTKYPSGLNIPQQVEKYAKDYDIIVIEGGTVDCGGYGNIVVPLGYLSDGYELEQFAGANTFIGGIERAFYYATTLAPDAIIVCVIPYSCPASKNFNNGWERLYQYIPYVCEKWGIPCVNLYKNETVNKFFDYDRSKAGLYYYDDLHCSPLGYSASSLEIAMGIYGSTKYNPANRHMPEEIPYLITEEATGEPVFQNKYISCAENVFTPTNLTKSKIKVNSKEVINIQSDFISVTPGDTVYFGPCSPYEASQIVGFDSEKKNVTGDLTSSNLVAVGYFNNSYIIYEYTVPDSVHYVKCTLLGSKAPMITINQPYDIAFYNNALNAVNNGQEINFPLTVAPVTTAEINTEPEPVLTSPETTEAETGEETEEETDEGTVIPGIEPGETGCKGSACAAVIFIACAAGYVTLRKKY